MITGDVIMIIANNNIQFERYFYGRQKCNNNHMSLQIMTMSNLISAILTLILFLEL